jgi:SH3 domain
MISTAQYPVRPLQDEYVGDRGDQTLYGRALGSSIDYARHHDQALPNIAGNDWSFQPNRLYDIPNRRDSINPHFRSHMSPPLTPKASKEVLPEPDIQPEPTFHNYLRAFYPFHPSSTVSSTGDESSITIPINQGDVILVHSVHPNGWADGTLLTSGARGWLPTNYCEPFEPVEIRNLLNSLTNLWDMVRSTEHESLAVFSRQDYVRGMIAGVRFFLVRLGDSLACSIADPSCRRKHHVYQEIRP